MDIQQAIMERRSIRRYTEEPIAQEDVQEIIQAGLHAPSAVDLQPWYFVAVTSPEKLEELQAYMGRVWDKFEPVLTKRFANYPAVVAETKAFLKSLGGSKCCVLAFMLRDGYEDKHSVLQGIAAALQNMQLAAYAKGIGSCWMTAAVRMNMGEELRLQYAPEHGEFVAAVTFGYPAIQPKAPKRKDGRYEII